MKNLLLFLGIACLSLIANAQQVARSLVGANGKKIGFYQYKPKDYTTSKKYPLIIFLHGIGERGNGTTDLGRVNANAVPRLINAGNTMTFTNPNTGSAETFLVLCPQLDVSYGSWETFYVDEMLKYAKTNLSVDTKRIFLTGISLGGGGVWKYATASLANASQFAGIIPCCGTGEGTYYCNLSDAKVGVWAFHAMDDQTVGVGNTQYAQIKLTNCNPTVKPKFTYYASGGHGIWERAFDPGHGFQNPNVYEWMLTLSRGTTVVDPGNNGNTVPEKPTVPANVLPVAKAGNDQAITLPTSSVTVDGSTSTDSDGTIATYAWSKVSGPASGTIVSAGARSTQITGLAAGTYVFQLTVTDNSGGVATDNVTISVSAAVVVNNKAPIANAGNNFSTANNYAYLSAGASYDPDGSLAGFAWSQVSGPNTATMLGTTGMFPTVKDLVAGVYVFKCVVTDNGGASASATVTLTVTTTTPPPPPPVVNKAPIASAGGDLNIVLPVTTATLNGSLSYDPDGTIASYAWTKISGPATGTIASATASSTQLTGLTTGVYVFQLKVTDNSGTSATANVTVLVIAASNNKAPYCNAGNDFSSANNYVYLSAGASYDPDGKIVAYTWTLVSGPNTPSVLYANTMFPVVQNLVSGTYVYKLVVTDNAGATATDQVSFSVSTTKSAAATVSTLGNTKIAADVASVGVASLSVSPNPATNYINLAVSNEATGKMKVVIFDAVGKVQASIDYTKPQYDFRQQINITGWAQGVYYLQITVDGKTTLPTQKFVKL